MCECECECARVKIGCAREDSDSNQTIKFRIPGSHIHTHLPLSGFGQEMLSMGMFMGMLMYIIGTHNMYCNIFTIKLPQVWGGVMEGQKGRLRKGGRVNTQAIRLSGLRCPRYNI